MSLKEILGGMQGGREEEGREAIGTPGSPPCNQLVGSQAHQDTNADGCCNQLVDLNPCLAFSDRLMTLVMFTMLFDMDRF